MLDSCKVSTLNQGHLGEVCDKSVIATANNGEVTSLRGNATINSLIDANITNKYGDYKILFDKNAKQQEETESVESQSSEVEVASEQTLTDEAVKQDDGEMQKQEEGTTPALQLEDETEEE